MNFKHRFAIGLLIWAALCAIGVSMARAQSCGLTDKPIRYESGAVGQHLFRPCADGRTAHILSCVHASCDPATFGGVVTGIIASADQEAAYRAAVEKYLKWNCDAPPDSTAAALCKERDNFLKPPVWKVKPNGTATTRPAHTLTAGVLGTREAGRAAVGAVCDLTKPTAPATGGDLRAQWQGGPTGVVTICTRATP